jgi:hypothetical protein
MAAEQTEREMKEEPAGSKGAGKKKSMDSSYAECYPG